MDIQDIIIGVLVLIILYLLYSKMTKSNEHMTNLNQLDMNGQINKVMCDITTQREKNVQEYLTKNCADENKDLPNFRNSINNRSWCRVKEEEEIVTDVNKNSYCQN
jgi:hypothetical protein